MLGAGPRHGKRIGKHHGKTQPQAQKIAWLQDSLGVILQKENFTNGCTCELNPPLATTYETASKNVNLERQNREMV
jgi:hypothetical protein